jgi:hypothetical protein
MDDSRLLCASIRDKIEEQFERTSHLIGLLPEERLDWTPPGESWRAGVLLGHLLDCAAGFCALFAAMEPQRLAHFQNLRGLPVNDSCSPDEAITGIAIYRRMSMKLSRC